MLFPSRAGLEGRNLYQRGSDYLLRASLPMLWTQIGGRRTELVDTHFGQRPNFPPPFRHDRLHLTRNLLQKWSTVSVGELYLGSTNNASSNFGLLGRCSKRPINDISTSYTIGNDLLGQELFHKEVRYWFGGLSKEVEQVGRPVYDITEFGHEDRHFYLHGEMTRR